MTTLFFPAATDRTIPSVSQISEPSSAAGVGTSDNRLSELSDVQRESAIDKAQRRARTHKDAFTDSIKAYRETNNVVYLHVAEIHKVMAENSERQAAELIQGRNG